MFELFYNFYGLNQKLFLSINNFTNSKPIIAKVLYIFSYPFGISKFAIYYIIMALFFYYKIHNIKNLTTRCNKFWQIYREFTRIGIIYTCFGFTYAALKFSVNLPRPFCSLITKSFFTIIDIHSYRCLSSFPSAHVGLAVIVSNILWQYTNRIQKVFLILLVFVVAISRISLAVHYPADILYSLLVITLVIIVGNKINNLLKDSLLFKLGSIINQIIVR